MLMDETSHARYPAAMVNITNRCNLRCKHCFVFREGNPNDPHDEMDTETMLFSLAELQQRHGIESMLWMGGEPLLRPDVLEGGVTLFIRNTITTNGTLDLLDLPDTLYVVSIDGTPELNDEVRGKGSFDRVMKTLSLVPVGFGPKVTCQCAVTRVNEPCLEELVELLRPSRIETTAGQCSLRGPEIEAEISGFHQKHDPVPGVDALRKRQTGDR
jgi:MoaA/NifB/PqqE/SkfB family radical SAM enzyme